MSKLSEYLALIPKGLPNAMAIVEGISNNVKMRYNHLPENEKEEILKRRIICEGCPFNSKNAVSSQEYKTLVGESYETKRIDLHCSFCGCPIEVRTGSLKKPCGIEAWNENNPNNQVPLKWNIYGN